MTPADKNAVLLTAHAALKAGPYKLLHRLCFIHTPRDGAAVTMPAAGLGSVSSVRRHVAVLEEAGFIECRNNGHYWAGRPVQRPNTYRILTLAERRAALDQRVRIECQNDHLDSPEEKDSSDPCLSSVDARAIVEHSVEWWRTHPAGPQEEARLLGTRGEVGDAFGLTGESAATHKVREIRTTRGANPVGKTKRLRGSAWSLRVIERGGKEHYRTFRGSEADADAALAAFAAELAPPPPAVALPAAPAPIAALTAETTFADWADTYLATRPDLARRTADGYRQMLTNHLVPRLGARPLGAITIADGLALQRAMLEAGAAPVSVGRVSWFARHLLAEAHRHGAIAVNPFASLRRVRRLAQPPRAVLDPARFARLDALPAGQTADLLRLAVWSGLRRGELLALHWADIAEDNAALTVATALEKAGGLRRKAPKSAKGYRTVSLPGDAAAILRRRRLAAREAALAAGRDYLAAPVFPAADGVSYRDPDRAGEQCRRALHKLGLTHNLHGMRHAHATALLSAGLSPVGLQARLGHAHISTTLGIYCQPTPADEAAAVAILDKIGERAA